MYFLYSYFPKSESEKSDSLKKSGYFATLPFFLVMVYFIFEVYEDNQAEKRFENCRYHGRLTDDSIVVLHLKKDNSFAYYNNCLDSIHGEWSIELGDYPVILLRAGDENIVQQCVLYDENRITITNSKLTCSDHDVIDIVK